MTDYNNPRPLPTASASDPCTIVDNAISFDKVINGDSTVTTYQGKELLSLSQAIDKLGFGVAPFTFMTGGILQSKNLLVSNDPVDGFLYKYVGSGSIPLTVTAGTNPTVGSDWQPFTATDHNSLRNRNAAGAHDEIYRREFNSVSEMINYSALAIGCKYSSGGTIWMLVLPPDGSLSSFVPLGDVFANDFGIVPNDPSKNAQNTINNRFMISSLLKLNINLPLIDGIGAGYYKAELKPTIKYGSGVYYFSSNPLKPAPSDYSPPARDKVLGLKICGAGIDSTIFELRKTAGFVGTATFYSNVDIPNADIGNGGWKNLTFEDLTFRSPFFENGNLQSMSKRASDDWYSFSNITSGGWEKFFKFNRVRFAGLDEISRITGTSNTDEHHFTQCRFELIRENILYLDNNNSVIHRFDACDFEGLHGNFLKAIKGGWVVINGGTLILYPEFNNSGAVVRSEKVAIFNIQPNIASIDSRAGVYKLIDVSIEKYDPNYQFARIIQTGTVLDVGDNTLVPRYPASVADIQFKGVSFRVDAIRSDDSVNAANNHDVVTVTGDVLAKIEFDGCEHHQRHFYKMNPTTIGYSDGGYIRFTRPRLAWDPSKPNIYGNTWEGGTLADRCDTAGSRAIICTGATCITSPAWRNKSYNYGLDFMIANQSAFSFTSEYKELPLKRPGEKFLSSGETPARTGNTLYLYKGAIIVGGKINIPPDPSNPNTGTVSIYDSAGLIHSQAVTLSAGFKGEFTVPYASQRKITTPVIHTKWGGYSGTGTEVTHSSEVIVKYL
ncbi:hypothetical protein [Shewanella sp.]|uniref:hypothetical protein n=1 Tax=Shewanella sp. TaxID=50422 RepID=UPI001B620870|nr:hypothetical protein [Shewanella sp.]MBP6517915.1 hypothetical protein [Shewanella sp.]